MAYRGQLLSGWFQDRAPTAEHRACRRMAKRMGEVTTARVRELTPVGEKNPFDPRQAAYVPGHLKASIREKPVVETVGARGERVFESGAGTDVEYAPFVEHGTGLWGPFHAKYLIVPKKPGGFLLWYDIQTGRPMFRHRVMHPGSPGHHMFALGVAAAEHEFNAEAEPFAFAWAREVESRNHRVHVIGRWL